MQTAYLFPLTVCALILALGALGFRAEQRRGYGPLVVGVLAGTTLVVGKFVLDLDVIVYGAIAGLIGASLWNSWPKKRVPLAPTEQRFQIGSKRSDEDGYQT
jgi:mercuric ion transport protein